MTTDRRGILIIGSSGQVGWELLRTLAPLGDVQGVDYPEIDLSNPDSIRNRVRQTPPRVIVNAAAYTAVDKAESEPDLAMSINGTAPGVLGEEAKQLGALLVHYSTDYVFDGVKRSPYLETDPPNPLGIYGRSKLAGDQAVRQSGCNHMIFRLCWVYGARGRNFLVTMSKLAREREVLRVVNDQFGCPTWCRMIAEATAQTLAHRLRLKDPSSVDGLYHLAASGQTSWHGFAEAIVAAVPPSDRQCRRVEGIPTRDYPLPATRPACSVLSCEKLTRTFGLRLPEWRTSLQHVLEELK